MQAAPVESARTRLKSATVEAAHEVHLVFKTHLDVGFTNYARCVLDNYHHHFIPAAIKVSRHLREAGRPERLIWTTGSWLIYEYFERATRAECRLLEDAVLAGDITWHGLPFTTHTELLDASLFRHGLSLARRLDARFGKQTIAAKLTDVPGHTCAMVPLLAEAGIRFLHIGVNPASTPPTVPPVFIWQHAGARVIVMYHKGSYGDLMLVPGLDHAIAFAHTGDNLGPQSEEQIIDIYRSMRARFPQAQIHASTMDAYARALIDAAPELPVITGEMGDSWIHGAASDPLKVSQFRALSRWRRKWVAAASNGNSSRREPAWLDAFSRNLLLVAEHTWGMDEKTHLKDFQNYSQAEFIAARQTEPFKRFEASWQEQRDYLTAAVAAISNDAAAQEARTVVRDCQAAPVQPAASKSAPDLLTGEFLICGNFHLRLDPATGAISDLLDERTGRQWADAAHPLAVLSYETFGPQEYERFWRQYVINKKLHYDWAFPDFTKPGMESTGAMHGLYFPRPTAARIARSATGSTVCVELAAPPDTGATYGCPPRFELKYHFPAQGGEIEVELAWPEKPACRLPEALWLSFNPRVPRHTAWKMEKLGAWLSPLDVLPNGNRKLHGIERGLACNDGQHSFELETIDAALAAPGQRSLLDFNNTQPRLAGGWHFNLYNNIWGTNFPMWYDDAGRFRFKLRFDAPCWT